MEMSSKEITTIEYSKIKKDNTNKIKKILIIVSNKEDAASNIYVNMKKKKCDEFGIETLILDAKSFKDAEEFKTAIKETINTFKLLKFEVYVMLQRPIDKEFELAEDISISPCSDVDGTTAFTLGSIMKKRESFVPCTVRGIIDILKYYNIDVSSKNVLVINRSNILGKPLASVLTNMDATVTLAHSKTKNLKEHCLNSDIIITGMSNNNILTPDYFKEGAIIIDASTISTENGLSGDIKKEYYDELNNKNCKFTPVPGGVGPMTILSLIKNILNI